jgi:hypothetical protein
VAPPRHRAANCDQRFPCFCTGRLRNRGRKHTSGVAMASRASSAVARTARVSSCCLCPVEHAGHFSISVGPIPRSKTRCNRSRFMPSAVRSRPTPAPQAGVALFHSFSQPRRVVATPGQHACLSPRRRFNAAKGLRLEVDYAIFDVDRLRFYITQRDPAVLFPYIFPNPSSVPRRYEPPC